MVLLNLLVQILQLWRDLSSLDGGIIPQLEENDTHSVSPEERLLLKFAMEPTTITKQADKSQILVVSDITDYFTEAKSVRHLGNTSTYKLIVADSPTVLGNLKNAIHHFCFSDIQRLHSTDSEDSTLLTDTLADIDFANWPQGKAFLRSLNTEEARLGLFYLNPKLHKESSDTQVLPLKCPCRPIISMVNHPVAKLAQLIHSLLSPAMNGDYIEDYLRDTPDFLRKFEGIRNGTHRLPTGNGPINGDSIAFSLDVDSMYTNIDWHLGARATAKLWQKWKSRCAPEHPFTEEHVYNMVLFVLTHAYFSFGEELSKQIFGTAVGNSKAVVFANAFMG